MYLTSALLAWMESEWGGVVTHLKSSTDAGTGEVTLFKARAEEPGAQELGETSANSIS